MSSQSAILFSGGLDSTALLYWNRPVLAITIDYGQVAARSELKAARAITQHLGVRHEEFTVNLRSLGTGPMAAAEQSESAPTPEWWPFRNQILITLGGAIAHRSGLNELLVGSVSSDRHHADGTENFFHFADQLMHSQEGGLHVRAPAIHLSTEELIIKSGIPLSILGWCHSCNMSEIPCLNCRACHKQAQALSSLGFL